MKIYGYHDKPRKKVVYAPDEEAFLRKLTKKEAALEDWIKTQAKKQKFFKKKS